MPTTPSHRLSLLAGAAALALVLIPVVVLGDFGGDAMAALPDREADLEVAADDSAIDLGVAHYQVYRNPDSRHRMAVRLLDGTNEVLGVAYYEALDLGTHVRLAMRTTRYPDARTEGRYRLVLLQTVIRDRSLDAALRALPARPPSATEIRHP